MKRRLTLSKETLRTLDAQELAMVVGGTGSDHKNGHGKTGQHGSCNANGHNGHGKTGQHGSCNADKHSSD
jgi:hypothetical protein